MDLFSIGYDPAEWDMVSNRSNGEYLSLSKYSDDEGDIPLPKSPTFSDQSSDSSQFEALNFLDIKMMSSFVDISSLIKQRDLLQSKISVLTPGQFSLSDCYTSQLEHLNSQIQSLQQPSMVNIHHYTPTDAEFESVQPSIPLPLDTKGKSLITHTDTPPQQDTSLDNAIFLLEEEIKEKEVLVRNLWKTLKMQREELDFLKKKRNEEMEQEIFQEETETGFLENKMMKGLDDRIVIAVNIRAARYLQYTLDAQVDTGAMNSCAKHGAIPEY